MGGNTVPRITEAEHIGPSDTGDNIEAKRVVGYKFDTASSSYYREGLARTERYDYSSTTSIYVGEAPIGTSEAATGWTINKFDLSSSSAANGKVATDVSWANRAVGSFS